jgi:hypothetical protein
VNETFLLHRLILGVFPRLAAAGGEVLRKLVKAGNLMAALPSH